MNDIVTLITQTGFPIVACIFIARYFAKTIDNFRSDIRERDLQYREDLNGMKEALNGNTLVLTRVLDKLDILDDVDPNTSGKKGDPHGSD